MEEVHALQEELTREQMRMAELHKMYRTAVKMHSRSANVQKEMCMQQKIKLEKLHQTYVYALHRAENRARIQAEAERIATEAAAKRGVEEATARRGAEETVRSIIAVATARQAAAAAAGQTPEQSSMAVQSEIRSTVNDFMVKYKVCPPETTLVNGECTLVTPKVAAATCPVGMAIVNGECTINWAAEISDFN